MAQQDIQQASSVGRVRGDCWTKAPGCAQRVAAHVGRTADRPTLPGTSGQRLDDRSALLAAGAPIEAADGVHVL